MTEPRDLLTEQQVMDLLHVSQRTLQRMRQLGTGPPYVKVARRVLYRRSALLEYLQARERERIAERAEEAAEDTPQRKERRPEGRRSP